MKKILKKIILICVLCIYIFILLILSKKDKSKSIILRDNYIDASSNPNSNILEPFESTQSITDDLNSTNIMNKIDKILFINLEHRKDRLNQITNEFRKMDFPKEKIQRINAVNEKYNGHIGCGKSHIKAMENILKHNYRYTMIFEDDFVFSVDKKTFDKKLTQFFNNFNDKWDVIQLSSVYLKSKNTTQKGINRVESASTSSAYIINKPFVNTLLNNLNKSLEMMEIDMKSFIKKNNNIPKKKFETPFALDQRWYPLQNKSKWFIFKPYIGRQGGDAVSSSIMNNHIEGFQSNMRYFKMQC